MSTEPMVNAIAPSPKPARFTGTRLCSPLNLISVIILLIAVIWAIAPGLFAPQDPFQQSLLRRLLPPVFLGGKEAWWLGTDQLGRDVFSRIVYGARATLFVSVSAVVISCVIGTFVGLIAGYNGGFTDALVLRLIDMQLAFPIILLVIAIVAVIGASLPALILIMGISGWPQFARIVRSSVMSVRNLEYVDAAVSIGASPLRVIFRHIGPNVLSASIVMATFQLSDMILTEATLSFLGLGVQPPTPTWGGMVSEAQNYLSVSWGASVFPGIAIAAVILAINILGDFIRDALDPRLSGEGRR
ncbi:ABC transporter permease [Sodalis ligni]|uniref:ABC transporter permease n=1 Tax=Sodalis ligni TaxID=2697027 RepID=UPI00193FA229|nr:ABC transporter permease [Sodalis ligni]QWA13054.1 ABC transporter permease [Sodalis ligni]